MSAQFVTLMAFHVKSDDTAKKRERDLDQINCGPEYFFSFFVLRHAVIDS